MIVRGASSCLTLLLLGTAFPSSVTAIGNIRGKVLNDENEYYLKSSLSSANHHVESGTKSFQHTHEQTNKRSFSSAFEDDGPEVSHYFAEKLEAFQEKYPRIRQEDSKALVLREIFLEEAKNFDDSFGLEETLDFILNIKYDDMESIFEATHHEGFTDEVSEAFEKKLKKLERDNPDIPTLAEALGSLKGKEDDVGADTKAFVLHDLLIQAAEADYSLEESLSIIDIDQHEMETVFYDGHEDLIQDVLDAFEESDERQKKVGQDIVRYLQEHLVRHEDGTLHYQSNKNLLDGDGEGEIEKVKAHHRRLEHDRRLRWDKYYAERELLPKRLKEHGKYIRTKLRSLSEGENCEEDDEAICFSEELDMYEGEVEQLVLVMEEELGPCKST